MKEYNDKGLTLQIFSYEYLEAFKDKPRTENAKVFQFCRDYSEVSKKLLEKRKLDKYTQLKWFLQGLSFSIQPELFNHYNIDLDEEAVLDFESMLNKAYGLIETRKKIVELGTTNIKNDIMRELIDHSIKKAHSDSLFSGLFIHLDCVLQTPLISSMCLVTIHPDSSDKKIDSLTDMMRTLALLVYTLQRNISAFNITSQLKL